MTVKDEAPAATAATPNKDDKIIASIREQIAAATSDEERAIFEDALKRQLAAKETGSTSMRAPVAQTIHQNNKDPPPKKDEEELGCCAKVAIFFGDALEEQREQEEEIYNAMLTVPKEEKKDDKK